MRVTLCALLIAVAAALGPGAARSLAAPLPPDFFGVSAPDLGPRPPADRVAELDDQRAAGVRLLRQLFDWSLIEPTEGDYHWADTDSFVASAARADMKLLPVVLWSPMWASGCPMATNFRRCPPADYADFGNFVATLIGRYGPSGTFWDGNPTVPRRPIVAWQLWNEPALPAYWSGVPNAGQYVDMLRAVVPIIRAADPGAEIVGAGIPDSRLPGAISMSAYVSGMYAAGVKGLIDDIAIHIYDDDPPGAIDLVEQTRSTMNANGDNATGLWISEWGWASSGKPNRFVTTLAGQAANVDALMGELVARHTELGLRALTEYFWHDGSDQSNVTDTWDQHLGLVYLNYTHKPSYFA
jgi:polysaccharide biosynthesis protein PslG